MSTPTTTELTPAQRQWVNAYKQAKQRLADDQELLDRCREQIEAALGDAEVGTVEGQPVVRNTTVTSTRLDTRKLKEQHPDLYEQFCRPQMSRRFTVVDS